jgi:hypothetical protein
VESTWKAKLQPTPSCRETALPGKTQSMSFDSRARPESVVVEAVFKDGKRGFYFLRGRHGAGVSAHGEDLLEPSCRVAVLTK